MKQTAVTQAGDIDHAARNWLQQLFGRELSADETIVVSLTQQTSDFVPADKEAARLRLERLFVQLDERTRSVADEQMEDALDEACEAIRRRDV